MEIDLQLPPSLTPTWTPLEEAGHNKGFKLETPDGLYNPSKVWSARRAERPWHRLASEMAAAGYSNKEIAIATERTQSAVGDVLSQPYAQERIAKSARMNATEELKTILNEQATLSLKRIIALAQPSESTPAPTQLAANQEILNRLLGRPTQPILNEVKDPTKLTTEELERRVSSLVAGVPASEGDSKLPDELGLNGTS
jgi:hypothetical protein